MSEFEITSKPEKFLQGADLSPLVDYALRSMDDLEYDEAHGSGLEFLTFGGGPKLDAEFFGAEDILDEVQLYFELNHSTEKNEMNLVIHRSADPENYLPHIPKEESTNISLAYIIDLHNNEVTLKDTATEELIEEDSPFYQTQTEIEDSLQAIIRNLPEESRETDLEPDDFYHAIIDRVFDFQNSLNASSEHTKPPLGLDVESYGITAPYERLGDIDVEVRDLHPEEIREIVSKIALDQPRHYVEESARDFLLDELDEYLHNGEDLLMPKKAIELGRNLTVNVSDVLVDNDSRRHYVLAYNEGEGNEIAVRTFYRSVSHSTWRLLPDVDMDQDNLFCKGDSEIGITLPVALQKILGESSSRTTVATIEYAFTKVIPRQRQNERIHDCPDSPMDGFYKQRKHHDGIYLPELHEINHDKDPNFEKLVAEWVEYNPRLYGSTRSQVFYSCDGAILYLYKTDEQGRAWLGNIELANSGIKINGLLKKTIPMDELITPPIEYARNLKKIGVEASGDIIYTDSGQDYVSNLKHVQLYKKSLSQHQEND